jgi:prepilin peptidase CpaA
VDVQSVVALAVGLTACATDLKSRRIPNVLTFGASVGALAFHAITMGWAGLGESAAGWLVGLALFLPFFVLRGIGGGDVKLVAALGAWVGPGQALWLGLWSAIAGGPLALLVALSRGYTRQAIRNVWSLLTFWRVQGLRPHPGLTLDAPGSPRLPYALPITVGLIVTLWRA